MKQQNIEISPKVADWYDENFQTGRRGMTTVVNQFSELMPCNPATPMFSSPDQASEFMLTAWKAIWRNSLAQIKGQFTADELRLIIDVHNAHAVSPQFFGSDLLLANISDAIALDGLAEKWDVDPEKIKSKTQGLTAIQALCLELWSTGFWYGKNAGSDLDGYVDQLV